MMPVAQALSILEQPEFCSSTYVSEAKSVLIDFATDMLRMLEGLARVSFPIPGHVRITLDPDDESDAVFITLATADRIYRALGAALAVQP